MRTTTQIGTAVDAPSVVESVPPEGWTTVLLPEVCDLNPPKPSADSLPPVFPITFVPMPAVDAELGAITNPEVRPYASVRKGYTAFQEGDVIFAKITPCMENGKAAVARKLSNRLGFGSTEFHVLRPTAAMLAEYVYYFIRQESFRRGAEAEMTGSVGQRRVPTDFLKKTEIPLAPLPEQKRIVAKIEELFTQVNATRDRLAKVPKILKRFRQSVLAAACSGRLTEDWRERNPNNHTTDEATSEWKDLAEGNTPEFCPAIPERWQWVTIDDAVADVIDYRGRTPPTVETGIPHVRTSNIRHGRIDWNTDTFVTEETYQKYMTRGIPRKGDILFTMEAPLGEVAEIEENRKFSLAQRILLLRGDASLLEGSYLAVALRSPQVRAAVETHSTGSNVNGIAYKRLRFVLVPIPPLPEQHEIVRRVEALFKLADMIEKRVEAATKRAEKLTQAILAKAFRGELVPTEAELARREGRPYEPASALLDRIKSDRERSTAENRGGKMARRKATDGRR